MEIDVSSWWRKPIVNRQSSALDFSTKHRPNESSSNGHRRYGERDRFEELRISIIEGDIPGERPGYSVHVGPDLDNTFKRYIAAGLTVRPDMIYLFQ